MTARPLSHYLRFSLRTLFLLVTLVAIAITSYRWPWEESRSGERWKTGKGAQFLYKEIETTTFHRDWRGRPVKHGPMRIWHNGQLRYLSTYYEGDLHGPQKFYDKQGKTLLDAQCRLGKLHGTYRSGDGDRWRMQGEYRDDQPHGEWRILAKHYYHHNFSFPGLRYTFDLRALDRDYFSFTDLEVVVAACYDRGLRHGKWTWSSADGEVVNTAEFNQGDLVRWNGEPVVEQFLAWLRSPEVNDQHLAAFFSTAEIKSSSEEIDGDIAKLSFATRNDAVSARRQERPGADWNYIGFRGLLAASLCEEMIGNDYRFDYRYGMLWLVPAEDADAPFVDRTGVAQIAFEPESEQEQKWNAFIDVHAFSGANIAAISTIELLGDSKIEYDIAALYPHSDGELEIGSIHSAIVCNRRRRDAIGQVLYETGCRVEQRGNKLIFTPRPGRTDHERTANPFPPPLVDPFG